MAPLTAATLLVVVASQVPKLGDDVAGVLGVVPFYVRFWSQVPSPMLPLGRRMAAWTPSARSQRHP